MIVLPDWLAELPLARQPIARQRFLLKVSSLYASENGKMDDFSDALGYNRTTLGNYTYYKAELISVDTAIKIEKLLGRHIITRADLRPDIFVTEESK